MFTPEPSFVEQLITEYSHINALIPAQTDELLTRYWAICQLIPDRMQVAPDVHAYSHI